MNVEFDVDIGLALGLESNVVLKLGTDAKLEFDIDGLLEIAEESLEVEVEMGRELPSIKSIVLLELGIKEKPEPGVDVLSAPVRSDLVMAVKEPVKAFEVEGMLGEGLKIDGRIEDLLGLKVGIERVLLKLPGLDRIVVLELDTNVMLALDVDVLLALLRENEGVALEGLEEVIKVKETLDEVLEIDEMIEEPLALDVGMGSLLIELSRLEVDNTVEELLGLEIGLEIVL